ncbi:MAG: hypothetical protein GC164_03065 [Phycisphaera sp.]|nr:hypothetical protein [Phycisphaera sp.]
MLPNLDHQFSNARAHTEGESLIVTTGWMRREWRWTGHGLATTLIHDELNNRSWHTTRGECDWELPDASQPPKATLTSLTASVEDDEGFTSKHLCVRAEFDYPTAGYAIRLTLWAYPLAPGLRTLLSARKTRQSKDEIKANIQGGPRNARAERIPIDKPRCTRRWIGYYNATQQRNDTHLDILKQSVTAYPLNGREWCDWASAACVEDEHGGIALVKESHKCVNQPGHVTGGFVCDEHDGLSSDGWGMRDNEISTDRYTDGWATWSLLWSGGDFERTLAFKAFDRLRYPIDPKRDIYIQANTWGSTDNGSDARRAGCEQSVLREIERCAEMGIDSLQIDDGWQVPPGNSSWQPGENGWRPHPESYPDGWKNVRTRAQQLGVKLGLWAAAQPVSLDELKANFTEGGFTQFKLDFAILRTKAEIDELMAKVREFITWTGHKVRINWDVTENPARYGYFFAREYGCIYLENRKPAKPVGVVYRPHTVLRDLWQIAQYLNLHRFQCSIQNVERTDPQISDAHLHDHSYATAIALMGIPLFFLETKYYTDNAVQEIRKVLAIYKQHRDAIYRGVVHPIGNKPDNASWTGFQSHLPDENRGYLTLYRERCNPQPDATIQLGWLRNLKVRFTDLLNERSDDQQLGPDGSPTFTLPHAPGFAFLRYDAI